jgi:hypothetical protein
MKVAMEKEQLKAVVRQGMISVLEEDVYGTPDPGTLADVFDTYTSCPRHDFVTRRPSAAARHYEIRQSGE